MSIVSKLQTCRICKSCDLQSVISLGEQYITSRFPDYGDFSTPKTNVELCKCNICGLLQLLDTVSCNELYEYEYGYRSGINNMMKDHLKQYKEEIESIASIVEGDTILDIGSNDSTMLQYYSNNLRRIGIDPTGNQFKEYYGEVELVPTYFTVDVFKTAYNDIKCKVISSISMFYDLPDPIQFAQDIYECLHEDGIWTCEQSYLLTMVKRNSIDTICHEHLEYYALKQIKHIADVANFKIIDVKFNDCNGGSFRIYLAKRESTKYVENTQLINQILQDEIEYGINDENFYAKFMDSCNHEVDKLKAFINIVNSDNKTINIYGASTKGNTLLQFANITENDIKYAIERNPKKYGKMTNTGIKIISEDEMRKSPPDYLLVLPYHFKSDIIKREHEYLENGGQLIFPFPNFEIYSEKPKLLITGCDGFIGSYIKDTFTDYVMYGIIKNKNENKNISSHEKSVVKIDVNMQNSEELEKMILIIKPAKIIHLASISSSQYAFNNPVEAAFNNGMLTTFLCDIIHRNKMNTILFNASSSEIYKGHIDYEASDNDTYKYNNHPYAIAKIMGHSMVDFYRETHQLPFSNGIIFTTESSRKSPVFLLNKIARHIKIWKETNESLLLGNLKSFRNIIHPLDVASAIKKIIEQPIGNNYLICNEKSYSIFELVVELYRKAGIELYEENGNMYCDGILVIKIEDKPDIETNIINIRGYPTQLYQLGWKSIYSMDDILNDILSV